MRKSKNKLIPIWQTFDRVRSTGAATCILFSGRSIGKTWDGRKLCIDTAARGMKFFYLRKYHSMVTWRKNAGLFVEQDDYCIEKLGGTIDFSNGRMAFINTATDEVIGWAGSLQDAYLMKGQSFPDVQTIFFDEFLDDAPLEDEFALYQNVISTITRNRKDVTIYLAANTIRRDNVYFRNFGIDIAKMRPGDVVVVNHSLGATVAAEWCRASAFIDPDVGRVSNRYVGFDNGPETRMILYGEWTHPPIETREIDGITWASERNVLPVYVYIQGAFYEMSVCYAGETAFVRKVNAHPERLGVHVRKIITSEFHNTFKHTDGTIVPKYLTFASTGNDMLLEDVRLFKRFREAGRIIGVDPVDTHDFLRFFDSMPV